LPWEEIVREGWADLEAGRCTIPGCLVAITLARVRRAGLVPKEPASVPPDPELQLYRMLREAGSEAFSRYNILLRQLVSFEQALDRRIHKTTDHGEKGTTDHGPGTADY
jgi:hypothetical protein